MVLPAFSSVLQIAPMTPLRAPQQVGRIAPCEFVALNWREDSPRSAHCHRPLKRTL